jgi:hypothetical protein
MNKQPAERFATEEDVRSMLHAADCIAGSAGRAMLAKILKGPEIRSYYRWA